MWLSYWLRNRTPQAPRRPVPKFRPAVEQLDARWLPSTLTVTNPLDDGSAGSLRYEVAAAHSGDTIAFDPSLAGQTIALSGGELFIDKTLDIEGLGADRLTVSALVGKFSVSRVFEVAAGATVAVNDLTIQSGNGTEGSTLGSGTHDGDGGGILNLGTLTLNGCTVSDSYASQSGGGIYNTGTLTLGGCTVISNQSMIGGGIYNHGQLTVTDSTVSANTASYRGGGIYNSGPLFKRDPGGTATIAGCTIEYNSATDQGGGIYNGGTMTVGGSTVDWNDAIPSDSAGGLGKGGGVYNAGSLTVTDCTVTGNSAWNGGGIYNTGTLSLTGSTVTGNDSAFGDDDLYNTGRLRVKHSTIG